MGVSINGDPPIAGWFKMENSKQKCMIWWYPHFRKRPYNIYPLVI